MGGHRCEIVQQPGPNRWIVDPGIECGETLGRDLAGLGQAFAVLAHRKRQQRECIDACSIVIERLGECRCALEIFEGLSWCPPLDRRQGPDASGENFGRGVGGETGRDVGIGGPRWVAWKARMGQDGTLESLTEFDVPRSSLGSGDAGAGGEEQRGAEGGVPQRPRLAGTQGLGDAFELCPRNVHALGRLGSPFQPTHVLVKLRELVFVPSEAGVEIGPRGGDPGFGCVEELGLGVVAGRCPGSSGRPLAVGPSGDEEGCSRHERRGGESDPDPGAAMGPDVVEECTHRRVAVCRVRGQAAADDGLQVPSDASVRSVSAVDPGSMPVEGLEQCHAERPLVRGGTRRSAFEQLGGHVTRCAASLCRAVASFGVRPARTDR